MRIKAIDFDPNQDFAFSAQELIIGVFKNLGSLLNFSCAIAMGLQLGFWYETRDLSELDWPELETDDIDSTLGAVVSSNKALEHLNRESGVMTFICLFLWCKVLHLLIPFNRNLPHHGAQP